MQQTLKITNVLSDPTRFSIYEFISKKHQGVTVQDIANEFNIHPNVARLHLSKLEDVHMLRSENKKTGRGGRPSRIYHLSDEVIELSFPFRDYHLLAKIAIDSMMKLGSIAENALYETGKRYGEELMENELGKIGLTKDQLSFEQKINILESMTTMLGLSPDLYIKEHNQKLHFQVFNCPFHEIVEEHKMETCNMHIAFIKGMLNSLFEDYELITYENMFEGCESCSYLINIKNRH